MIFIGDLHGEIHTLRNKIEELSIKGETFIQVGDFGLGFKSKRNLDINLLYQLNEFLSSIGSEMYVIRGNHDNPSYWYSQTENFTHLHLIKDNELFPVEDKNVLFIGGAHSINRIELVQRKNWWKGESINMLTNLDRYFAKVSTIDIVVSHSSPSLFYPHFDGEQLNYFLRKDLKLKELIFNKTNKQ